jgi:hypothetical protein
LVHCSSSYASGRRDSDKLLKYSDDLHIGCLDSERTIQVPIHPAVFTFSTQKDVRHEPHFLKRTAHAGWICATNSTLDAVTATLCMAGVLLVIQPTYLFQRGESPGVASSTATMALLAAFGSLCASCAAINVRMIGPSENPLVIGEICLDHTDKISKYFR